MRTAIDWQEKRSDGFTNVQHAKMLRDAGHDWHYIAGIFGASDDAVRKAVAYAGEITEVDEKEASRLAFRTYMRKGRTQEALCLRFGEDLNWLLEETHPGLQLFKQINEWGRTVYALLPRTDDTELNIQPRIWEYHRHRSEEGMFWQPYILIQMPDNAFVDGEILIAPLFDVHFGHYGHKRQKLHNYLKWIAETPNVYTFLGGDLIENAVDDGRGMTYSQEIPPDMQVNEISKLLAPIAHKILFATTGNHERRTQKRTGIDVMEIIAGVLKVPYFSGPVYCSILGREHRWRIYAFHNNTNSQTKGGKLNSAGRPRKWTDFVNFFVSGHTHDPLANTETCIVEDPVNCCLRYVTQWTVVCPSFLRWEETYAYEANYPPPGKGGVAIHLYADGNYAALHRDM